MSQTLLPTQFLLYGDDGYDSHVIRFLLEEKGLDYRFIYLPDERPEHLAELNPYATLPILVGRDLTLYELGVIFEYLEERHGANKLLPATPNERAKVRQLAWRLQQDWLSLGRILMTHPDSMDKQASAHAKAELTNLLTTLSPLFARHEYFMQDNFGLCDVLILPLLHRLPTLGVHLSSHLCKPLLDYQKRLTTRPSFQKTLIKPIHHDDDFF